MSIAVALAELAEAIEDHDYAYLVTVSGEGRAHLVAVVPVVAGGVLEVGDLGLRTMANAADRPDVTLVWPPRAAGGHSLIVDGTARLSDRDALSIAPSRAVLHRPAPAPVDGGLRGDDTVCGNDCAEVPLPDGPSSPSAPATAT